MQFKRRPFTFEISRRLPQRTDGAFHKSIVNVGDGTARQIRMPASFIRDYHVLHFSTAIPFTIRSINTTLQQFIVYN